MMIKRMAVMSLVVAAAAYAANGQDAWTLRQCVDYALENNLTVKNTRLQVDQARLDVTSAKDAFLPSLSASAAEGFNFGRGLTSDNTYADRNTSNFQWGVNLSLPLFQGLSDVRQLKAAKSSMQQYLMEFEAAKDDLTLNIISQYLQVPPMRSNAKRHSSMRAKSRKPTFMTLKPNRHKTGYR